mmetsp:Transcript_62801/g.149832  ORF Transcript_62801/g.149832 Transcript_62801/m.149832 type:complete len:216 (+) Transcript_62801:55-702(+)
MVATARQLHWHWDTSALHDDVLASLGCQYKVEEVQENDGCKHVSQKEAQLVEIQSLLLVVDPRHTNIAHELVDVDNAHDEEELRSRRSDVLLVAADHELRQQGCAVQEVLECAQQTSSILGNPIDEVHHIELTSDDRSNCGHGQCQCHWEQVAHQHRKPKTTSAEDAVLQSTDVGPLEDRHRSHPCAEVGEHPLLDGEHAMPLVQVEEVQGEAEG